MGNFKWNNKKEKGTGKYYVVLFISRNKDNKNVENFKERRHSFVSEYRTDFIFKKFQHFVEDGVKGEFCRCYISQNARDMNKVKKALIHELIDRDTFDFDYIEPFVASIAARNENRAEKKWFFDFDSTDEKLLEKFVNDIWNLTKCPAFPRQTPHGYAVEVMNGFDTRELMSRWENIATLKRDDLICEDWATKK